MNTVVLVCALIGLACLFQLWLMRHLSIAAQPYRLEIARGIRRLRELNAPDWLIEMWETVADRALFRPGMLRAMILGMMNRKRREEARRMLDELRKLPREIRDVHDAMDKNLALVVVMMSPLTALVMAVFSVAHSHAVSISRVAPGRDVRGFVLAK